MLELHDLQVAYGQARALWGVSLTLTAGELLCVVGPNGAGKTTLINAVAGVLRAQAGRIVLDGRDITALAPHRFCAAGIALVPAALVGAAVVIAADFVGQHLLPVQLPVGILTAAVGAPFLIYLLVRSNRIGHGG